MFAWTHLTHGVQSLAVFGHVHTTQQHRDHAGLIGIHNKFLIAHGQTTFEPACGVQHKVDPGQCRGLQRVGRFIGCLGIWQFGASKAATASKWHTKATGQRCSCIDHLAGLWGTKGGRARGHGDGRGKGAKNHWRPGATELSKGNARHGFGQNLGHSASGGHRRHGTGKNKG